MQIYVLLIYSFTHLLYVFFANRERKRNTV